MGSQTCCEAGGGGIWGWSLGGLGTLSSLVQGGRLAAGLEVTPVCVTTSRGPEPSFGLRLAHRSICPQCLALRCAK